MLEVTLDCIVDVWVAGSVVDSLERVEGLETMSHRVVDRAGSVGSVILS